MRKSKKLAAANEPADLDFPDWNGMDDSPARIGPDAAFRLCAECAAWFPGAAPKWEAARPEKCLVEFIL